MYQGEEPFQGSQNLFIVSFDISTHLEAFWHLQKHFEGFWEKNGFFIATMCIITCIFGLLLMPCSGCYPSCLRNICNK